MSNSQPIEMVTFSSKGQVVIPSKVRRQYGIEPGTQATVQNTEEGILIRPLTAALIRQGRGILGKGDTPLLQEWSEHKAQELKFENK